MMKVYFFKKLTRLQEHVNTHLISEISYNENEAKRDSSYVSPPLHFDLLTAGPFLTTTNAFVKTS